MQAVIVVEVDQNFDSWYLSQDECRRKRHSRHLNYVAAATVCLDRSDWTLKALDNRNK